jgi:hypothetical protein
MIAALAWVLRKIPHHPNPIQSNLVMKIHHRWQEVRGY